MGETDVLEKDSGSKTGCPPLPPPPLDVLIALRVHVKRAELQIALGLDEK